MCLQIWILSKVTLQTPPLSPCQQCGSDGSIYDLYCEKCGTSKISIYDELTSVMGFASTNPGGGGILLLNYSVLFWCQGVPRIIVFLNTRALHTSSRYFVIFCHLHTKLLSDTYFHQAKNRKPIFPLFLFLLQTSRAAPDLTAVTTGLQECSTDGQRSTDWLQTTNHWSEMYADSEINFEV